MGAFSGSSAVSNGGRGACNDERPAGLPVPGEMEAGRATEGEEEEAAGWATGMATGIRFAVEATAVAVVGDTAGDPFNTFLFACAAFVTDGISVSPSRVKHGSVRSVCTAPGSLESNSCEWVNLSTKDTISISDN